MLTPVGWKPWEIRQRCADGTIRELRAYLAAGLVLVPTDPNSEGGTMKAVAEEVCHIHLCTDRQLKGAVRTNDLVAARSDFCIRCFKLGYGYSAIGRVLGGRDHSSIIHLLAKAGHLPKKPPGNWIATHCRHGHEYTPENTYVTTSGWRKCKTCNHSQGKRRREQLRQARQRYT